MIVPILIIVGGIAVICGIIAAIKLYISRLVDKRIFAFQNDLIVRHCDEVQNIYRQMRGWRHDYHNHIQTLKAHLALEQYVTIGDYLNELDTDLVSVDTVIKTGNIMLDAILNSKISLAVSKKIKIDATAAVPESLRISDTDLCVIIGNLLDNAMEACLKLTDNRVIRVYIDVFNEYLYISVTNTMSGNLKSYQSSKGENHGFGLMRIDKITKKYGGHVNRQNEEGVFATEVMLPL